MAVDFNKIANLVRYHRKCSGLAQAELALLAGVGKTAVFDVEHGKPSIQWNTLTKILHTLNVEVNFSSPLMAEFEAIEHEKR